MKVCVVHLPNLPDKGDLYDYIEQRDSTDSDDLKRYIDSLGVCYF